MQCLRVFNLMTLQTAPSFCPRCGVSRPRACPGLASPRWTRAGEPGQQSSGGGRRRTPGRRHPPRLLQGAAWMGCHGPRRPCEGSSHGPSCSLDIWFQGALGRARIHQRDSPGGKPLVPSGRGRAPWCPRAHEVPDPCCGPRCWPTLWPAWFWISSLI